MKKKLNYIELIKESISIVWKNKRLLILGLLLTITSANLDLNIDEEMIQNSGIAQKISEIKPETILLLVIGAIIFTILFAIAHILIRISLISSIIKVLNNKDFSVKEELKRSPKNFLQFLGLGVLISFIAILLLVAISVPILLIYASSDSTPLLITLVFAAFLILIPAAFLLFFVGLFGQFYIIKHNLSIRESVKNSYNLLNNNIKSTIVLALSLFLFSLVLTIATGSILIPLAIALFVLSSNFVALISTLIISLVIFIPLSSFIVTVKLTSWLKYFTIISTIEDKETEMITESETTKDIEVSTPLEAIKSSQSSEK